jgi:predicted transcriptional regulator
VFGHKAGFIEYKLRLPMGLTAKKVAGCRLITELASKADKERLDWPARTTPQDYPQTDGKLWPTDITLSLNGVPFKEVTIQNDFADARGVLSHVARYHHGSCGEVVDAPITGDALEALKKALGVNRVITLRLEVKPDVAHVGGLALYGSDMGCCPADPTLVFLLRPDAKKPHGKAKILGQKKPKSTKDKLAEPKP